MVPHRYTANYTSGKITENLWNNLMSGEKWSCDGVRIATNPVFVLNSVTYNVLYRRHF